MQFSLPPGYCQEIEAEALLHKTKELSELCMRRILYLNDKSEFYELTSREFLECEELKQMMNKLEGWEWQWECVASMTNANT